MGQVLGFSHCKELGSVTSTPDSTPPCTDGGNEESELYELQTAREWSEDELEGGEEDEDDEGDLASSPSVWGTPRQHSYELTFSYIAIAEAEAAGASRHHGPGRRHRAGTRVGGRTPLVRTDTLETLLTLDSPDVEWDPHAFLTREEAEEGARRRREEEEEEEEERGRRERLTETETDSDLESLERDAPGIQRGERERTGVPQHLHASAPPEPPASLVTMDATVVLLAAVRQGGWPGDGASSASSASIGRNTQEQLVGEQWFSALNLSEGPTLCTHIAVVMDLIYWKDTERTGMVLTGLVVALLSLFQLSLITVVSTLSLAIMCFTISVRLYYKLLNLVNCGDGLHPFKAYLDLDISLGGEQADHYMQRAIVLVVSALNALKSLIFVGSFFDSLKFLVLMYLVTFLGNLCNGLTLLIVAVISLFSLPLFYRQRQEQVDGVITGIQANIDNVKDILQRIAHGGGPPPDPTPGGAKPKAQ